MENKGLYALSISFLVSFFLISFFFKPKTNFEELAFGEETKGYNASKNGLPTHIVYLSDFANLKKGWLTNGQKDVIFCLGNSQTHSINQMKDKEVNYVQLLSDSLEKFQKEVLCISVPNISLQEMALSFDYALNHFPIKYLMVPIFMDDLREDGIRADVFFKSFALEGYQIKDTSNFIVTKINREIAKPVDDAKAVDTLVISVSTQEKVETYLNKELELHSVIWKNRPQIRGDFFNLMYVTRNSILGIDAQTKRKMIPQRYKDNFAALEYILQTCETKKIKVLTYIPPIRDDVEVPYDLKEYENFKKQIETETKKYPNASFSNFEKTVPGKYWGVKNSTNLGGKPELDFMHFQYEGHKILCSNLYEQLKLMMAK